jgi:hypothetical protein
MTTLPSARAETEIDLAVCPPMLARAGSARVIRSISDVRRFFCRNDRPIYSIGPTDFNLAGMDDWVRNFRYISQIDCYDGRHPKVFIPRPQPHDRFRGIEDVNNYLLSHGEVIRHIRERGGRPAAVFLMFDQRTEALCEEIGVEVWFPRSSLRSRCDNKVETVRIGNRAGVPSVPNALAQVRSYKTLRRVADEAGLGRHLVVQTAYGDSGHTTFFISSRKDWRLHAKEIASEAEVKVMRRIDAVGSTLEACVTRCGTVVGPLLTEIIGEPSLTPYPGGWCGNEVFPEAFSEEVRAKARRYTELLGAQLYREGYRGYFDCDYLLDRESGELYLGELNPRICGASPITNHGAFAHADVPLFLFHLLEFSGADFDLDVGEVNGRWSEPEYIDSWSEVVMKRVSVEPALVAEAPPSGLWRLDGEGRARYVRFEHRRSAVETEREALFLRILGSGDMCYEGADLGILITRGRAMDDDFALNERARAWVRSLHARYRTQPLDRPHPTAAAAGPYGKMA